VGCGAVSGRVGVVAVAGVCLLVVGVDGDSIEIYASVLSEILLACDARPCDRGVRACELVCFDACSSCEWLRGRHILHTECARVPVCIARE
jgi:hypothetical protein